MIEYFETKHNSNILRGMVHVGTVETPIIMVHGFFSSNRVGPYRLYFKIAEHLNSLGYTVFRFDLSGMGESDGPSDYIEFSDHISDLNHMIKYVCKRCHTPSVHLLAHCIGCCTATESAIVCNEMVRTVTFISPFMPTDDNYRCLIGPEAFDQLCHSETFTRKPMICQKSYIDAGSVITKPNNLSLIQEKDLFVYISSDDEFSSAADYQEWILSHNIAHRFVPRANHNYLDYKSREVLFYLLEQRFSSYLFKNEQKTGLQKTDFLFVRHAESDKNRKEITGGAGEPLTELGQEQVERLFQVYLKKFAHPNLEIWANKVVQVHQTAHILSNKLNIPYLIDPNLKPAGMGILNGLSRSEASNMYPDLSDRMKSWRNGEIEACELNVPGMKDPGVYWKERIDHLCSLCDGNPKIIICSRSIMVWAHNFVNNHTPDPGGGYKHVRIDNCDLIGFTFDPHTHIHSLLQEYTTAK